jgi:O-methyltransferase domain/Dimerisation domain
MQHQVPPQSAVMHIIAGYWLSRTVYLAAKLKLADAVGDNGATLPDIATKTGTRPAELARLMRALASHGFFKREADGRFVQTPLSDTLRTGTPGSMRGLAEAELGHDHYESWGDAESCLRQGGTAFERLYNMPVWRYYADNPAAEALFGEAMTNFTAIANSGILGSYTFKPSRKVVDVGGGYGQFLASILDQQPEANGVLFDLPTLTSDVVKKGALASYDSRVKISGGDFFESVPAGGDLYLLKFILHDWDDEHSVKILRNVRRAITGDGKLAVVEIVLPPHNEPHIGPLIDLNMMVMTGGNERTENEYRDLLADAGFRLDQVVGTKSPFSVIEASPG